jgi:hypothetical protein
MSYNSKVYRPNADSLVIASGGTFTNAGTSTITGTTDIAYTSASTSGSTSIQPFKLVTTMTGAGGVGGRGLFELNSNVALGGWANALKAHTKFGASGRITGLASSVLAEMDLSAGCSQGTYAPLELELNLGTGALTGTETSLIYASVNGADKATFDTNGFVLSLQGLTANAGKVFAASVKDGVKSTHSLRIKIGTTAYYIPLSTAADFNA